ncbi:hypothetical protein [Desulfurobacterium sp.]
MDGREEKFVFIKGTDAEIQQKLNTWLSQSYSIKIEQMIKWNDDEVKLLVRRIKEDSPGCKVHISSNEAVGSIRITQKISNS